MLEYKTKVAATLGGVRQRGDQAGSQWTYCTTGVLKINAWFMEGSHDNNSTPPKANLCDTA